MPGLSRALEPAQGSKVAFGRLLLLPVTKKGLFFGPKKQEKLEMQIRASPVAQRRFQNMTQSSFFSIFLLKARGSANKTARNATLSHEMRFDRQKLR